MSYSGLGTAGTGSTTTLNRGSELQAFQQHLVARGEMPASAADGVISTGTSPTLTAVRASAAAMGLPTGSVARTSTGGLQLPTLVYEAIVRGTDSAIAELARDARSGDEWVSDVAKQVVPKLASGSSSNENTALIMVATGTGLFLVGAMALYAGSVARRRDRQRAAVTANRRRRR